jgi:hypothetical protein
VDIYREDLVILPRKCAQEILEQEAGGSGEMRITRRKERSGGKHWWRYRSRRLAGLARWRPVCIMRGLGEVGEEMKMRVEVPGKKRWREIKL